MKVNVLFHVFKQTFLNGLNCIIFVYLFIVTILINYVCLFIHSFIVTLLNLIYFVFHNNECFMLFVSSWIILNIWKYIFFLLFRILILFKYLLIHSFSVLYYIYIVIFTII